MIKTSELIWQDTQHQILFKLIDELKEEPFDRSVIDRLYLYAEHHFALEEAYMEALSYPHKDLHIKAHDKFRDELGQMHSTPISAAPELRHSLSLFLSEWLKRHVMGIDKEFEAFVLKSSSK